MLIFWLIYPKLSQIVWSRLSKILREIKNTFKFPTFSYQVSGEYSMLKQAILSGEYNEEDLLMETFLCFKRAGADAIISYFALDMAKILKKGC